MQSSKISNQRLRKKGSDLESKAISLESDHNSLEKYGWRNNIKICGITVFLTKVLNRKFSKCWMKLMLVIDDIETCHFMGSPVSNSRRIISRFMNRKFSKKALPNRIKLLKVPNHRIITFL